MLMEVAFVSFENHSISKTAFRLDFLISLISFKVA